MKLPNRRWLSIAAAGLAVVLYASSAMAATTHLGVDQWWFDETDWSSGLSSTTDAQLNSGYDYAGEGVVFDIANDPNFGDGTPEAVSPYLGYRLYLSHTDTAGGLITVSPTNKLTIKSGELQTSSYWIIGRNTNTTGVVVQEGGVVRVADDIRFTDSSAGATGIYDYRGGDLITTGTGRIRMAKGATSNSKFIVRNTGPAGQISIANDFIMTENAAGISVAEFHYGAGGVRVVQVGDELSLRNNDVSPSTRSARLDLILDEAPELKAPGVPEDLALFDITTGLAGNGTNVQRFYDLSGLVGSYYDQGDIITASYGGTTYKWAVSYRGVITYGAGGSALSDVASIAASGGRDVVLIGVVPEPASVILLGLAGLALLAVRRR
jgi:hypothetical protein